MPSLRVEQHGCSPQGRNTVKPEHGGKLQRRHQTSPGWGLQQAGSSRAARPLFFFGAGGVGSLPPTTAFTTLPGSASATGTAQAAAQPER